MIIAVVGAKAATFDSAKNLVSWVGACPGDEESDGVNRSKSSCPRCRQTQRKYFRDRLSSFRAASWTQQNDRSHCASPMSLDLDHFAQKRSL